MTQKARHSLHPRAGSEVRGQVLGAGIAAPGWHVCRSNPWRRLGARGSGLMLRLRLGFGACLACPAARTELEGSSRGLVGAKPERSSGVWCVCVCVCVCVHAQMCYILRTRDFHLDPFHAPCVLVAQSCLTLGDPKDCNPPGSSVHGILQARMLEWAAIPFTRGSSQHSDQTPPAGGFFTAAPPGKLLLGRPSCFLPKDSASGDAHRMDSASGDTHRIKCLLMTDDSVV